MTKRNSDGKAPGRQDGEAEAPSPGLSFDDAEEAATFLVRIFGEEAREIAALRADASSQKDDWQRVGKAVDEVLQSVPRRRRAPRRRFRAL